jgi:hypothetical protein
MQKKINCFNMFVRKPELQTEERVGTESSGWKVSLNRKHSLEGELEQKAQAGR